MQAAETMVLPDRLATRERDFQQMIEESHDSKSYWSALLHLVPKMGEKYGNYRALNARTVPDQFATFKILHRHKIGKFLSFYFVRAYLGSGEGHS